MSLRSSLRRGAITLISAGVLVGMAGAPAPAAPGDIKYFKNSSGTDIASFQWNADPHPGIAGESVRICDLESDGWFITVKVTLASTGAQIIVADTQGNPAWYCTPWIRQNDAPEGAQLNVTVKKVRAGDSRLLDFFPVWA